MLLSQLFLSPSQESPQPKGADVPEPAANLLPWIWLHWFGGFGGPPLSANHSESWRSSGFTEGCRSSVFKYVSLGFCTAAAQVRPISWECLCLMETSRICCFLRKQSHSSDSPSCPSLQGPACGDTVRNPRAGNPSLVHRIEGTWGLMGGWSGPFGDSWKGEVWK